MKPKGLLIAVVLLAVLGGLVWFSNRKEAAKAAKGTDTSTKILTIPEDQLQEIRIKKLTGETINLSKDTGKWRMTEPKPLAADQEARLRLTGADGGNGVRRHVEDLPLVSTVEHRHREREDAHQARHPRAEVAACSIIAPR